MNRSIRRLVRQSILLALATAPLAATATNGYFSHGFGIRNEALAGAGIAFSQDALAPATNPAGLADVDDGYEVSLNLFRPSRGATLTQGGTSASFSGNGKKIFPIPSLGYARALTDTVSFGIALYGNGGLNTDYTSNPYARFYPPTATPGEGGVDLSQAFITPAVSLRIGERSSAGLAVNIAYQRFKAKGIGAFAGFSQDPANVSNRGYDDSLGLGVRLGWQTHVTDAFTVGATWQSKTKAKRFKKYAGLFADGGDFDIPSTYGVGVAFKPAEGWDIALDWQKIEYSKINSVGNSIASLFGGSPLGSDDGPGFGWRDVTVVKLGTQVQVSPQFTLRLGVSHNRQPVQAGETFFNILAPGVVRTHATLGGSWKVGESGEFSVSYLHAFKKEVDGSGSIPPAFGGGEADVRLTENSLGFGWSHRF